jgi:hypothetical protein
LIMLKTTLCVTLIAALLSFSPAFVRQALAQEGASLASATDEQKATAGKAFEEGLKQAKAGKHEEALASFRASYGAVASPNSHMMVARELVELGKLGEAYAEYEKTVTEAEAAVALDKKYAAALKSSTTERDELRKRVHLIQLSVTGQKAGDKVTVGAREIPESEWQKPIAVAPGNVTIELVSGGAPVASKSVEATAGGESNVELAPTAAGAAAAEPPPQATAEGKISTSGGGPNLRTWAYIAGGVGVAGLITFGVFGLMSNSKHGKLEDECTNGVCSKDLKDTRDQGKAFQTIANIGLVVGIVGVGTGTVLYLMSGNKSEKTAKAKTKPKPFRPDVSVGYRSVVVSGSF